MPKFCVTVYCTCAVPVVVEADDEREAIAKVKNMTYEELGVTFTDTGVEGIDNFESDGNYSVEEMK